MADGLMDQNAGDGSASDQNLEGSETQTPDDEGNVVDDQSQSETPKWMGQLPKDLKGNETLTQYQTLGDLGKAFLDLEGKVQGSVEVPGEDATEEQWSAYREKMGIPESPDNYEFEEVELPNGATEETEMDQWFRKVAHENNFTNAQANAFRKAWVEQNLAQANAQSEAFDKAREDAEKQLRSELGEKYDETLSMAKKAVEKRSPEFAQFLTDSGLTNHPEMVKLMADIGVMISEDRMPGGKSTGRKERPSDPRDVDAWVFENTPGMND